MRPCLKRLFPALLLPAVVALSIGSLTDVVNAQSPRAGKLDSRSRWAAEGRPLADDLNSRWVQVVKGGAMVGPEEGLTLSLILFNKGEETVWVGVHFETPRKESECEQSAGIAAGMSHRFSCPQKTLAPDELYQFAVSVFTDAERRSVAEKRTTSYRFPKEQITALETFRKSLVEEASDP